MPFIKMTWPWGKLFKEFILGAQNLFFSLFKKKKRERERKRRPLFFKDVGFMQLPKVHLAGSSSSAVDLSFQIFAVLLFF